MMCLSTTKGSAVDERLSRIIRNISTFEDLAQFEKNADQRGALDADLRDAIRTRSAELGRTLITQRTGLDLSELSPAEEKIVQAVSEYVGVMKREGKDATRTFIQLKNRGFIGAAETAVAKLKPTQGFLTLADADLEELSYEQIIVDYPDEFSARAQWYSRRTLGLTNETDKPPGRVVTDADIEPTGRRNPAWFRDELILALELYLRLRDAPPGKESQEVAELSAFLGRMARGLAVTQAETFRNANGVYMKMMNFRRFDPNYTADGKVGLTRGNKEEEAVWNDFATDPVALAAAVAGIRAGVDGSEASKQAISFSADTLYWVFVCNPKKWAIDWFLERGIERDTWGIRPSDRSRFAPGQLGIVRVGVDQRNAYVSARRSRLQSAPRRISAVSSPRKRAAARFAYCAVKSAGISSGLSPGIAGADRRSAAVVASNIRHHPSCSGRPMLRLRACRTSSAFSVEQPALHRCVARLLACRFCCNRRTVSCVRLRYRHQPRMTPGNAATTDL
jgi:hypothetical protein